MSVVIVLLLATAAAAIGLGHATMPQGRVETIDAARLHLTGEFVESNLGTAVEPDGSVTVRAIGQQYSFTPACILVPVDTPITLRATSADVVHGILIQGTNINTMLVPGYISEQFMRFHATGEHLMPCQEFCSFGHEGMWGKVRVIDKAAFAERAKAGGRLSCVGE
jgi:cytochrome c oxidase subunit 2